MKKKFTILTFLLISFSLIGKTQNFDVEFKGMHAGSAVLKIPDVLLFPSLSDFEKRKYEVSLTLLPSTIAGWIGARETISTAQGEMSAVKTFPLRYTQKEDGQSIIEGEFLESSVTVKDVLKNKNKIFQKIDDVYDPLSLIIQLQQSLKGKNLKTLYTVVDNKKLNKFSVSSVVLKNNSNQITLKSINDKSEFVFEFNIALDLVSMTKRNRNKELFTIKAI